MQPAKLNTRDALFTACTGYTKSKFAQHKAKIENYLDSGNTKSLNREIKNLVRALNANIAKKCTPIKKELAKLVKVQIPAWKSGAKAKSDDRKRLQEYRRDIAAYYPKIAERWSRALDTIAKQDSSGPGFLTGRQSQTDFSSNVGRCNSAASGLKSAGVDAKETVAGGATLAQVSALCQTVGAEMSAVFAKLVAIKTQGRAKYREDWVRKNLIGNAMRDAFKANNERLPAVENLGDKVVWVYRSYITGAIAHECKTYEFNKSGSKLLSRDVKFCR